MNVKQPTRHWVKDAEGNHIAACEWSPNEEDRMAALWLKFLRWLDARGLAQELRQVRTRCPCGFDVEICPCAADERIAH